MAISNKKLQKIMTACCKNHADAKLRTSRHAPKDPTHQSDLQVSAEPVSRAGGPRPRESEFRICSRVQVWLHEQSDLRIEGRILGFDEPSSKLHQAPQLVLLRSGLPCTPGT